MRKYNKIYNSNWGLIRRHPVEYYVGMTVYTRPFKYSNPTRGVILEVLDQHARVQWRDGTITTPMLKTLNTESD